MPLGAPTLLLVEDDDAVRESLDFLLSGRYRIVAVADAQTALARCLERPGQAPFDALLVDLHLGDGADGICCLQVLKALPGYADVPAIALSGLITGAIEEECLTAGFTATLRKPFLPDDLENLLDDSLSTPVSEAS